MKSNLNKIEIDKIRLDGGTQPRVAVDVRLVDDYAAAMLEGATFPEVTVYCDGKHYWLADGFHRVLAATKAEEKSIACLVHRGTQRDAILASVGANASHGLRRSNADKRAAVQTLLKDAEWCKWSDREIARRCAVSRELVGEIRAVHTVSSDSMNSGSRTFTHHKTGQPATMNTAAIGKAAAAPSLPGADWTDQTSDPIDDEPAEQEERPAPSPTKPTRAKQPTLDQIGQPVPEPLRPLFEGWLGDEIQSDIQAIRRRVSDATKEGDPHLMRLGIQAFDLHLKNAWENLKFAAPYAVCPACAAKGCRYCEQAGWLSRSGYEQLPRQFRRKS